MWRLPYHCYMELSEDRAFRLRMATALLLIAALPFGFALAIHWTFLEVVPTLFAEWVQGTPTDGIDAPGANGLGRSYVALSALLLVGLAIQYAWGDRFAMRSAGARRVDREEYPDLHARVERLAQRADLPAPDVAVVKEDAAPNAFAVGRSPRSSTVAVTSGLLDDLEGDELDAVLAHELAHVKNRDGAIMTAAYLLPSLTYAVAAATYTLLVHVPETLVHVEFDDDSGPAILGLIAVFVVTSLLTLLISTLFWAASYLMHRVLSRHREYAADRAAAALTDPFALASALETIDEEMRELPDRDLRLEDGGIEALYIAPLETDLFDREEEALLSRDIFPATHPPTDERIDHLTDLGEQLHAR